MKSSRQLNLELQAMAISIEQKNTIKRDLVARLQPAPEISKIIIFGSFIHDEAPHDIDVAIVQNSNLPSFIVGPKYALFLRSIPTRNARKGLDRVRRTIRYCLSRQFPEITIFWD